MKSQATLVWAESGIELDPVASVDLKLTLIILPDDSELNNPLWDRENGERSPIFRVLLKQAAVLESAGELYQSGLAETIFKRNLESGVPL
jgi:hypothetical protein